MKLGLSPLGLGLCLLFVSCEAPTDRTQAARQELQQIARQLDTEFSRVRQAAAELAQKTEKAYLKPDVALRNVDRSAYRMTSGGAFYKHREDGNSALWISGAIPVSEEIKRIAYLTEAIETDLQRLVKNYPAIIQAYYNDRHSLNRIFPPFDVLSQYPEKMDIPSYNFYYLADPSHNPEQKAVWVDEPYVDPAGRGWMVSAIAPVYTDGTLQGVAGVDITIATLTKRALEEPGNSVLLVDRRGVLVTAPNDLIRLLGMLPLGDYKYIQAISQDTYRKGDYNLLRSKDRQIRRMAKQLLQQGKTEVECTIQGAVYRVLVEPVPELQWFLLTVIPR